MALIAFIVFMASITAFLPQALLKLHSFYKLSLEIKFLIIPKASSTGARFGEYGGRSYTRKSS